MFNFGDQLYRLTGRDLETLLVEPYFRQATGTIVSLAPAGSVTFPVPLDRCLYIHSLSWIAGARSGSAYSAYFAEFYDTANILVGQFFADEIAGVLGQGFIRHQLLDLVLPPQTARIQLQFNSGSVAATSSISANLAGYLIPPGRIGRA